MNPVLVVACTEMTVTLVELVEKGIGDDEDEMLYSVLQR